MTKKQPLDIVGLSKVSSGAALHPQFMRERGWSIYYGAPHARRASLHREVWGGLPLETAITLGALLFCAGHIEKNKWRCLMCIYKPEVRPGLDGIIDHLDVISDVKSKINPILILIILANCDLARDEVASLAGLFESMLDEAWSAADGIYAIYQKEVRHAD